MVQGIYTQRCATLISQRLTHLLEANPKAFSVYDVAIPFLPHPPPSNKTESPKSHGRSLRRKRFVTQSSKSNYKAIIVSPEQAFRIMTNWKNRTGR